MAHLYFCLLYHCLSICFMSPVVSLSLCLSACLCVYVFHVTCCISVSLSVCLSVCLCVSCHLMYLCLSVCLPVCVSMCFMSPVVCLSVCVCQLMAHLPARAEGSSWHLLYSSSVHGYSLRTLYRQMMAVDSPILLIVMDTDHHVSLSHCCQPTPSSHKSPDFKAHPQWYILKHISQWYILAAKTGNFLIFFKIFDKLVLGYFSFPLAE